MAIIHGNAALTIFQFAFIHKYIYLSPPSLLVSDTEFDRRTDGTTNTANLCIYVRTYVYIYIYTLVTFVCVFLVFRYEMSCYVKASVWFYS
jgi:hypothetical protein